MVDCGYWNRRIELCMECSRNFCIHDLTSSKNRPNKFRIFVVHSTRLESIYCGCRSTCIQSLQPLIQAMSRATWIPQLCLHWKILPLSPGLSHELSRGPLSDSSVSRESPKNAPISNYVNLGIQSDINELNQILRHLCCDNRRLPDLKQKSIESIVDWSQSYEPSLTKPTCIIAWKTPFFTLSGPYSSCTLEKKRS